MAAIVEYSERLKDPRWQRKRLEIFERDNFTCQECGRKDRELHVHHGCYVKGRMPWEYPNEVLHTLCDGCHEIAEQLLTDIRELIGRLGFSDLSRLKNWLVKMDESPPAPVSVHPKEPQLMEGEEVAWLTSLVGKERRRQGIVSPLAGEARHG